MRLIAVIYSDVFDGWETANHLDVLRLPIRQALNTVWHYLTRDASQKGIDRLKADLIRPLPGLTDEVSDEVVSAELGMFQAALGKKM